MKTQNHNFSKLPVKDLAKKIVCDGHLFLMSGERKFYLMKPGIFIDQAFIKKHAVNNPTFEFETVVNESVKEKFKMMFRELRYLQFEKDLKNKCLEIVNYFHEVYSGEEHFLSFALACHEVFCHIPQEIQSRMHETDMNLFRKSLYSSAFATIIGIANDFYYFLMIRDFYTLTFTLDIGLCESNYSYFVAEACNSENLRPGSGKSYLENEKASKLELEVYLKHPERSYKFVKGSSLLSYQELSEVTLYQHELSNGSGFPRGIVKSQVSSWEAVVILADSLVEITTDYSFEKEVVSYLVNFQNQKINDLPVNKAFQKVITAFAFFKQLKESGA
jgi:hypothetical protein